MSKSKVIDLTEKRIQKSYYSIGFLLGVLRAELETGRVAPETAYNILSSAGKELIKEELIYSGENDLTFDHIF